VNQGEIEALIGPVLSAERPAVGEGHASPGLHPRHYRPRTRLLLVDVGTLPPAGRGAFLRRTAAGPLREGLQVVAMPSEARAFAAVLYESLHRLDGEGLDWIAVERVPEGPEWAAVADRLARAAAP